MQGFADDNKLLGLMWELQHAKELRSRKYRKAVKLMPPELGPIQECTRRAKDPPRFRIAHALLRELRLSIGEQVFVAKDVLFRLGPGAMRWLIDRYRRSRSRGKEVADVILGDGIKGTRLGHRDLLEPYR
jgi:hypothetical protein